MSVKVIINNKLIEISPEAFVYFEDKDIPQNTKFIEGEGMLPRETWEELDKWAKKLNDLLEEFPILEKT